MRFPATHGHKGIFHLGTFDSSEEFDFLTTLTKAFGYDSRKLTNGDKYNLNMTVFPKRIYELYGKKFKFSEQNTIEELQKCPYLAKYSNNH